MQKSYFIKIVGGMFVVCDPSTIITRIDNDKFAIKQAYGAYPELEKAEEHLGKLTNVSGQWVH